LWNVVPAYPWNVTAATWNWGDGSSSNVLYTSHQYSAAGMYNICLTVTVSCTATASSCASYSVYRSSAAAQILQVDVIAPALSTGIKTANVESTFNWHVFPNPNSGNFQIVLDELSSEQIKMTLTDLTGRVLYEEQINTSSSQSISPNLELPSGIYFVCVESDHFKTTKRMIVSR
jgi:PKD repeat protein